MSTATVAASWTEHRAQDGKVYFYNKLTKQSTWEKPDEMKSVEEKTTTLWKEYTAENGKKYYYHPETKVTTWDMPQEYKDHLKKLSEKRGKFDLNNLPEVLAKEDAEGAFKQLLQEKGILSSWSWEQTLRAIINHPAYGVLKTIGERKNVFKDYIDERRREEREEKRLKTKMLKEDFEKLLASTPEITILTRYREARELVGTKSAWLAMETERDREVAFDDYIEELKKKEKEEQKRKRKLGSDSFTKLIASMPQITVETMWDQAQELFLLSPAFQEDELMVSLPQYDLLSAFEDYMKGLERKAEDIMETSESQRKRKERQNRDAFKVLLHNLVIDNKLTVQTSWAELLPLIKDDPRFLNLIGQSGSTALDFYYDLIEQLEEDVQKDKKMVKELFKSVGFSVTPQTPLQAFLDVVNSDGRARTLPEVHKRIIHEDLVQKAVRKEEDIAKHGDKKRQKKIHSFFSLLRKNDVTETTKWEDVKPKILERSAFTAIETEEQRIDLFAQYKKDLGSASTGNNTPNGKNKRPFTDVDDDDDEEEDEEGAIPSDSSKSARHL